MAGPEIVDRNLEADLLVRVDDRGHMLRRAHVLVFSEFENQAVDRHAAGSCGLQSQLDARHW